MGRRAATALHLALILTGAVAYIVFVLPRWWVLIGTVPPTLATVGRIAAALPIGAAAVPVWLTLQRSLAPDLETPELALRLRAWSAVLHVVAAVLILLAAVTEIWLSLQAAGPWLFGVYGAAGAVVILAVAAFYLSFVAEKPPAPPKPQKPPKAAAAPKAKKAKRRGKKADDAAGGDASAEETAPEVPEPLAEEAAEPSDDAESEPAPDPDTDPHDEPESTPDADPQPSGALRNKRPTGKRRFGR